MSYKMSDITFKIKLEQHFAGELEVKSKTKLHVETWPELMKGFAKMLTELPEGDNFFIDLDLINEHIDMVAREQVAQLFIK